MVHGLHHTQVLIDNAIKTPAPLFHISLDPTNDPNIIIGIHKNFDIHQVAKALVFKNKDPLNNKDILWFLAIALTTTRMRRIIIGWNIHRTTC